MLSSLQLLPPIQEQITFIGEKVRGAGWYGHTIGLHTLAIRVLNFRGRISVKASVVTEPTEVDWYSVLPDKAAYIQYPRPGWIATIDKLGETSTFGFNFTTNAVWLRAQMDRAYLLPSSATPLEIMPYGAINYVTVNYTVNDYALNQRETKWTVPWI